MGRRHHILVVDDEPGMRVLLERVMKRAGFEVQVAGSLEEALPSLHAVDLVVTDYFLAPGTGADVMRAAQAGLGPLAPPAILITATPEEVLRDDRELFLEVLAKPFRLPDLVDRVHAALADRRLRSYSGVETRPAAAPPGALWRDGTDD
ncbi:MAG: response regulator [Myxococcales bacterium]|nr:response regulator [Myxococcales bacterium]